MNMMANIGNDGLNGVQRAEIYRRQMLIERDRLEIMHANLHIIPPEEQGDIDKALSLRLVPANQQQMTALQKAKLTIS